MHRSPASTAALVLVASLLCGSATGAERTVVGRQDDGSIFLPTGARLAPAGRRVELPGRPNDLAVSPDGALLAVANLSNLALVDTHARTVATFVYPGSTGKKGTSEPERGIVFSPHGDVVYVSTRPDAVQRFDVQKRTWLAPFALPPANGSNEDFKPVEIGALPAGLALSKDGGTLYVALGVLDEVVAIDTASGTIRATAKTGVAPSALALSGATLAVANQGGAEPAPGAPTAREGRTGQLLPIDPRTGATGSGTVTLLDPATLAVRATVTVGRHPAALAFLDDRTLAVAEANDDDVATIDVQGGSVLARVDAALPDDGGRGAQPQALARAADGSHLYVALAGADAVASYAVTGRALHFEGALPTDWYPGALAVLPAGGLAVANLKGVGALAATSADGPTKDDMPACGATGGMPVPAGGHDSHAFLGSIGFLTAADLAGANAATTARALALATASKNAAATLPPVRHVFLIVRENRTYDQVFGDLAQGNGDPRFTNYPRRVTPNAHALAEQYVLLDNFYSDGTQSGDGHQWLVEAQASDFVERSFPLWARAYPKSGDDALAYAGAGFLWDDAAAHGKSVRDYGEFVLTKFSPATTSWRDLWSARGNANAPVSATGYTQIPALAASVDDRFPGYTTRVPDQVRMDEFARDFATYEARGTLPDLIVMSLGDDHTAGFKPGFPRPCSMIADNDLALGRLVDIVSHSKFWNDSVIFVTEDDSQDGLDHVDGHRQPALVIGPNVKRRAVISTPYSQLSMLRTAEVLLGLPPIGRFDAAAPVMNDVFATAPDVTAYRAQAESIDLAEMNAPLGALAPAERRLALDEERWFDPDVPDTAPPGAMSRILWADATGGVR